MIVKGMSEWDRARAALKHGNNVLLRSDKPALGKSMLGDWLKAETGLPLYALAVAAEAPVQEYRGWQSIHDASKFNYGPAVQAYCKNPGVLQLDEFDNIVGSGDVEMFFRLLADRREFILPNGERVAPASGFRFFATTNASWDHFSEPLLSRFPIRVEVTQPNPAAIAALPASLRKLACGSNSAAEVDLRQLFELVRMREQGVSDDESLVIVFGERAQQIADAITIGGEEINEASNDASIDESSDEL